MASGPNPDNETYTVTFKPGAGSWTALGLEVVQDESLPGLRVARGADRVVITEIEAEVGGKRASFSGGIVQPEQSSAGIRARRGLRRRSEDRLGRDALHRRAAGRCSRSASPSRSKPTPIPS